MKITEIKGRVLKVPEGPGLGVEFDWDWIEDHKTGEKVYE